MPPALAGVPVDVEQQQQHAQPVDDDEQDPEDQCGPEDGAEDTKEFQYDAQEERDAGADEQQAQPLLVHRIEEDVDHPGQLALRRGFVLAGESSALHGPQALQNGFRVLLRLQRRTRRHLCRGDIQERHVVQGRSLIRLVRRDRGRLRRDRVVLPVRDRHDMFALRASPPLARTGCGDRQPAATVVTLKSHGTVILLLFIEVGVDSVIRALPTITRRPTWLDVNPFGPEGYGKQPATPGFPLRREPSGFALPGMPRRGNVCRVNLGLFAWKG